MLNRRDFSRIVTTALGGALAAALGFPVVRFLLDPLSKRGQGGGFRPLTRLSRLEPGKPQSFPIIDSRRDAWVKYPKEPVGSIWLVRRGTGPSEKVEAFTAACPHLGCAIGLAADGEGFLCPCHVSRFGLDGRALNDIPPRGMDPLQVELSGDADPEVRVHFQRFQAQLKESKPLA